MFTGAKIHSARCAEVRKKGLRRERGEIQAVGFVLTMVLPRPEMGTGLGGGREGKREGNAARTEGTHGCHG